jgi:hypothetical protein
MGASSVQQHQGSVPRSAPAIRDVTKRDTTMKLTIDVDVSHLYGQMDAGALGLFLLNLATDLTSVKEPDSARNLVETAFSTSFTDNELIAFRNAIDKILDERGVTELVEVKESNALKEVINRIHTRLNILELKNTPFK